MSESEKLVKDIFPDEEMDRILDRIVANVINAHATMNLPGVARNGLIIMAKLRKATEKGMTFEFSEEVFHGQADDMDDFVEKAADFAYEITDTESFMVSCWLIGPAFTMNLRDDGSLDESTKTQVIMVMGISADGRRNLAHIECTDDQNGFVRTSMENASILKVADMKDNKRARTDTIDRMLEIYFGKFGGKSGQDATDSN